MASTRPHPGTTGRRSDGRATTAAMTSRRSSLSGLAIGLLLGSVAWGYVMPGFSILRHMAEVRNGLNLVGLRIDGSATFYGPAAQEAAGPLAVVSGPEIETPATLWMKVPGRCRLEVGRTDGQRLAVSLSFTRKKAEPSELAVVSNALEQLCPLLSARTGSDLETRAVYERHLRTVGVDMTVSSLARFGGQVAYVLGQRGEGQAQLWIYKDEFLPARMRFPDAGGVLWDVRFHDYTSPATGEWFPRVIEVWRAGQPAMRFTGLRADARPKLDDKLFP
jgi:hypothetical protein